MNEVCRISAAQQLQRLDSFLMEANVTKIEKVNLRKESILLCKIEKLLERRKSS